ncbi:hypothetical protein RHS01_08827 [Rhizoctonia solani]|uniref:Uncharacterized protein n=1 Tax=Rhizoctonia solani TaxID=456999 RepID=A0A8H7LYM0_9AGAM|nr:hypothetical protein RHS01_08827 [Rhizoctonia solani]
MLRKHLTLNGITQQPGNNVQPQPRWHNQNGFDHSGGGFLPANPIPGMSKRGLDFLLQRLQGVALQRRKKKLRKERQELPSLNEWPTEPAPSSEPLMGLPEWVPDALNQDLPDLGGLLGRNKKKSSRH